MIGNEKYFEAVSVSDRYMTILPKISYIEKYSKQMCGSCIFYRDGFVLRKFLGKKPKHDGR
jgi:hypothetical protein